MKKIITFIILIAHSSLGSANVTLDEKLNLLVASYPSLLSHVDSEYLYAKDGTKWLIDDKKQKTHKEKLVGADIQDMLEQVYPLENCATQADVNFDPGRIRSQSLLKFLFGDNKQQVRGNTQQIDWFGQKLVMTQKHGAAEALTKVEKELSQYPKLKKYLTPSAGTFNWRNISGTNRLSVHSFAAAIDLNTKYAAYWKWSSPKGKVAPYKNQYPSKIISIFEKHGFIWGGRWYHYDTMHFEFRPELIAIANTHQCVKEDNKGGERLD